MILLSCRLFFYYIPILTDKTSAKWPLLHSSSSLQGCSTATKHTVTSQYNNIATFWLKLQMNPIFLQWFCRRWEALTSCRSLLRPGSGRTKWWSYTGRTSPGKLCENKGPQLSVKLTWVWQQAWQGLHYATFMPQGFLIQSFDHSDLLTRSMCCNQFMKHSERRHSL